VPPCGVPAGCSTWFVLPLDFRVHNFMVARDAYNVISGLFFWIDLGLRPVRNFLSWYLFMRECRGNGMTWLLIRS
jgi:hypothetical protein